jgi:hypothetical protein
MTIAGLERELDALTDLAWSNSPIAGSGGSEIKNHAA